jgi:hypothetical protein
MNEPMSTIRPSESELSMEQLGDLKVRINELIWQYAPEQLSLRDADALAGDILVSIRQGKLVQS